MRTDPARFDRVVTHPEYERAPAQPVLPADASIGIAAVVGPLTVSLFGIVFLLIALTLLVEIRPPLVFTIAFVAVALLVIAGGLGMFGKLVKYRNAPIARHVAVIVKERSEVSGGDSRPTSTTYYTTLQTRDGARTEYFTYRSLVGRLALDDIGVAYVKSRTLVEFIRFEVD